MLRSTIGFASQLATSHCPLGPLSVSIRHVCLWFATQIRPPCRLSADISPVWFQPVPQQFCSWQTLGFSTQHHRETRQQCISHTMFDEISLNAVFSPADQRAIRRPQLNTAARRHDDGNSVPVSRRSDPSLSAPSTNPRNSSIKPRECRLDFLDWDDHTRGQ